MLSQISKELLVEYLHTIKAMDQHRGKNPKMYGWLDYIRQELHDKLLKSCGKDRTDEKFNLALSTVIEEMFQRE